MAKIRIRYPNSYLALRTRLTLTKYLRDWAAQHGKFYCEHYEVTPDAYCISVLAFKNASELYFFLLTTDLTSIPSLYTGTISLTDITVILDD